MKIEFKPEHKKQISLKIIIVLVLMYAIVGFFMFEGMFRKAQMDASVEAYKVDVKYYSGRKSSNHYKPTYYYTVDGVEYTYRPFISTNDPKSAMKDPTLYYDSSNPSDVIAEYETKLYFGDYLMMAFMTFALFIIVKSVTIK